MREASSTNRPRIKVAVCGETGAGKTVFLTCLFETVLHAFPESYIVDFDRYSRDNNALYFDGVAQAIIDTGTTTGTQATMLRPLTILLTPETRRSARGLPPLAVDLMDFAGGNFHALSALTVSLEDDERDESVREALRTVHTFVESADAFVILLSAADIAPLTPRRTLFTPSVNTLLALCRSRRTPVALVLSQSDRVSPAAVEEWLTSPRVELFRRHFSDEPGASGRPESRPFGLVEALTCYREVTEGLEPRRQSGDNSIWLTDAARVVARLVVEATPAAIERFERETWKGDDEEERAAETARAARTPAAAIALNKADRIVIAVCGEPAAGKTVFLTCLFRTFARMFADDVLASYNRDATDATHFQAIEDEIFRRGSTVGTLAPALRRVELTLAPLSPPAEGRGTLSIELKDFAGRHFRVYADRSDDRETDRVIDGEVDTDGDTDSERDNDSGEADAQHEALSVPAIAASEDAEAQAAAQEVRTFIDNADAFVVLISAHDVDPAPAARKRDPFGPSVELVLRHARERGKPVALLFSQADRVPAVTDAYVRRLPPVRDFSRHFTGDLGEAASGARPFGVARPIACYEAGADGVKPRLQTRAGSIWREEPAEIVTLLVRALIPRMRVAQQKALIDAEDDAREQNAAGRRRNWYRAVTVAGVAALLLLVAFVSYRIVTHWRESGAEQVLRRATAAVNSRPLQPLALEDVRGALAQSGTNAANGMVNAAVDAFATAITGASKYLDETPRLERAYVDDIGRLTEAVGAIAPVRSMSSAWPATQARLDRRRQFVDRWLQGPPREWRERWGWLRQEAARFSLDPRFAAQIRTLGTQEKTEAMTNWRGGAPAASTVPAEITRVLELLQVAGQVGDPEYTWMARNVGAAHLAGALLAQRENRLLVDTLIKPLASDLASTPAQHLQFSVFANRVFACLDPQDCRQRLAQVGSAIEQAAREADELTGAVQNTWANLLPASRPQRLAIWRFTADALAKTYFFDMNGATWPADIVPLPLQVQHIVGQASRYGTDPTDELTARLSRPLYCNEMLYLHRRLAPRSAEGQASLALQLAGPPDGCDAREAGRQTLRATQ